MTTKTAERVIDDSYEAVFTLSRQQLGTHCADVEGEAGSKKYGMENLRISKTKDGQIVTESTKGTMVIKVTEQATTLKDSPFSVNPSESPEVVLNKPVYISGALATKLHKSMPQRDKTTGEPWQKEAVFSFTDHKQIEVGYADKQGDALLDTVDVITDDSKQFPPIESVWPTVPATLRVGFKVALLKQMVDVLERAEIETVALEFFERTQGNAHYDSSRAMKFEAVEPRPGKGLPRKVEGLVVPENSTDVNKDMTRNVEGLVMPFNIE